MQITKAAGWLLAGAALGAAAGVLLWYSPGSPAPETLPPALRTTPLTPAPAPIVGSPAPDFTLAGLDGREVTLSGMRGKAVILNFWATWCEPCREELPLLDRIAGDHADTLAVIAVDSGEAEDAIRRFAAPLELTALRILADPSGRIRDDYLVRGLPTSFFLDPSGVILRIQVGTLGRAEIESILKETGALP